MRNSVFDLFIPGKRKAKTLRRKRAAFQRNVCEPVRGNIQENDFYNGSMTGPDKFQQKMNHRTSRGLNDPRADGPSQRENIDQ
jgi:hypothetical protein